MCLPGVQVKAAKLTAVNHLWPTGYVISAVREETAGSKPRRKGGRSPSQGGMSWSLHVVNPFWYLDALGPRTRLDVDRIFQHVTDFVNLDCFQLCHIIFDLDLYKRLCCEQNLGKYVHHGSMIKFPQKPRTWCHIALLRGDTLSMFRNRGHADLKPFDFN